MTLRRGGQTSPLAPRYKAEMSKRFYWHGVIIQVLGWAPRVPLERGLTVTIDYFRNELKRSDNKKHHNGAATAYLL